MELRYNVLVSIHNPLWCYEILKELENDMICKNCGRELSDQAKFCKYCGAHCASAAETAAGSDERLDAKQREKGKRPIRILVLLVCLAAVLVGIVAGVMIWKNTDPEQAELPEQAEQAPEQETEPVPVYTASILPDEEVLRVGGSVVLTAAMNEPLEDLTVKGVLWETSDPAVATVADGVVYGIAEGMADITATLTLSDDTEVTTTCTLQVEPALKAYTLKIIPAELSISAGTSGKLETEIAEDLDEGVSIEETRWTSANSRVASVSQGTVQGVAEGAVLITASVTLSDGQVLQATVEVTVTPAVPVTGPTPNQGSSDDDDTNPGSNSGSGSGSSSNPGSSSGTGDGSGSGSNNSTTPAPQPRPNPNLTITGVAAETTEEYVIANSAEEYISMDALSAMTDEQLLIARNEIYARHGWIFQNAFLRDYFASQEWYEGTTPGAQFDPRCFNDFESENLARILYVEASRD